MLTLIVLALVAEVVLFVAVAWERHERHAVERLGGCDCGRCRGTG